MTEEKTALARRGVQIATTTEAQSLAEQLLSRAGLLPKHIKTPADAVMIMLTGAELGLGPMASLRGMHCIEGRVSMSAEMMLAVVASAGVRFQWLYTDSTRATIRMVRDGWEPFEMSWTIEEAKAASLTGKGNWKSYPAAMLRARCASAACRAYCPDLLGGGGVYTPDELESSGVVVATLEPEPEVDPAVLDAIREEMDAAAERGDATEVDKIAARKLGPLKLDADTKARMVRAYKQAREHAVKVSTPAPDEAESEGGCGADDA